MQTVKLTSSATACRSCACSRRSVLRVTPFTSHRKRFPVLAAQIQQNKGEVQKSQDSGEEKGTTLTEEELQKLAALRRQQQRIMSPSSNALQGAVEEIQLITWPTPKKAFLDTLLVLAIVTGSGVLLFGVNIFLSQAADWWYHIPHPDWLKR